MEEDRLLTAQREGWKTSAWFPGADLHLLREARSEKTEQSHTSEEEKMLLFPYWAVFYRASLTLLRRILRLSPSLSWFESPSERYTEISHHITYSVYTAQNKGTSYFIYLPRILMLTSYLLCVSTEQVEVQCGSKHMCPLGWNSQLSKGGEWVWIKQLQQYLLWSPLLQWECWPVAN